MKKEKTVAVIFCPPLSSYKEQPSDISKCELIDCPLCKEKMWLSEKKNAIKKLCEITKREIFFGCYDCFEKEFKNNKEIYADFKVIRIDV